MKKLLMFALLATVTPAPALAQTTPAATISPLGPNSALLSLSAEGRSRRTPDLAQFSAGVVTQGRNAAEAMAANSRQMDSVIAALRRAGIPSATSRPRRSACSRGTATPSMRRNCARG